MHTGTIRLEMRPDGSSMKMAAVFAGIRLVGTAANSKAIFPLNLMWILFEPGFRNFGLPFSQLARHRIHSPIAQLPVPGRSL